MEALESLIARDVSHLIIGRRELPELPLLLPGSFNPLHIGHLHLLRTAEKVSGRKGLFELSVANVDKPSMARAEIERRLETMGSLGVVLTCAPTFAEKAELFRDSWFVLGYDTAIRLLNPSYHADIRSMLARFADIGTRFVVGGRLIGNTFHAPEALPVPNGFADLFISLPESSFREDISSTQLRKRTAASRDGQ